MKIVLFGDDRRVGAWDGDHVVYLRRALATSIGRTGGSDAEHQAEERLGRDLEALILLGKSGLDSAAEAIEFFRANQDVPDIAQAIDNVKLQGPWPRRRIACMGGNFADHLAGMMGGGTLDEITKTARDQGQWGFWKVPDEVTGPDEDIPFPARTEYLDYEGEGAIILGKRGKNIPAEQIDEYVWGVTLLNDISIRDGGAGRSTGMSYNVAKNFDGSVPLGPAILVGDDLPYQSLEIETKISGDVRQHFTNTAMIWSYGEVLEYLSRDFTFVPGDIISGGTAQGTAADKTPRPAPGEPRQKDRFLKKGDVIEISSPQIGTLTNRVV